MSTLPQAPDFVPAIEDLLDHLPDWWAAQDPSSEMYLLLAAIAGQVDLLAPLWQQPYLDQAIGTASLDGLRRNHALAWGVANEQSLTQAQLAAYVQALAGDNGTLQSMVTILTALLDTPVNTTGGPLLTFPAGGGGLTFPADGSGLPLYEFAPGDGPSTLTGLVFPIDGSGLMFPLDPAAILSDNEIVADGTTPLGAGPGLVFASNQFVTISQDFTTFTLTVQVPNWMQFDRGTFRRAVERFQAADWYPTVIEELPIL